MMAQGAGHGGFILAQILPAERPARAGLAAHHVTRAGLAAHHVIGQRKGHEGQHDRQTNGHQQVQRAV